MYLEDNRTRVKICGITQLEHARYASGAMVDFLGFIFYDKSPRYIQPEKAGAIANWLEGPQKVGVFVNQPLDDVNHIALISGMDLVQLHGEEPPEYIDLLDKPVIKSFRIQPQMTESDLRKMIDPYLSHAEYLLFDAFDEKEYGGTGKTFDWDILQAIGEEIPFFLAGGISAQNVRKAISNVQPFAVDVSSSLESQPGVKDFDKMDEFIDEMREIWDAQERDEPL